MKIGLLMPSLLMAKRYAQRIYAPKNLLLSLADNLVDRGHDVFVYAASGTKTKATLIPGNKELEDRDIISVRDSRKGEEALSQLTPIRNSIEYELSFMNKALIHAKENNLEILHAYQSNVADYFAELSSIPMLFTLHDPVFDRTSLEYNRLKQFPHHFFNAISASQQGDYKKSLNFLIADMIHHGISVDSVPFSLETEDYACFIGRYLPEKGVDDALQVAISENIPLKLASSPNYKMIDYYKKVMQPFMQHENIEELPFLLPPERDNMLKKAKLLFFPIKWEEPFGMVMIEAMATGTPVVAYARGSVPEIVKDGETGFIINQNNEMKTGNYLIKETGIEGLREAVSRMYAMPDEEYKRMRRNARKHVETHFSVQKMTEEYENLYQKIIQATGKKS